jgi:serine acetyltransferase
MRADHRRLVQALRDAGDSGRRSALTHHSFICAALYRLSRHCFLNGHKYLSRLFWHLNAIVTGADIPGQADLGPGLLVPTPAGIAIAGRAGRNFTPMALTGLGSELGRREDVGAGPGLPVVGDDVTIEPHGGILGPIRVGNGVRVTAGVFLVRDAPDFAVARAGAPRFLGRRDL